MNPATAAPAVLPNGSTTTGNLAVPSSVALAASGQSLAQGAHGSVVGLIALLEEPLLQVRAHAIKMLNEAIDYYWPEVSDAVPQIEAVARELAQPQPAWLLLSKVYFHLGRYEESVSCALKAGSLFSLHDATLYTETILTKAIDMYIECRQHNDSHPNDLCIIEPGLEEVVDRMIEHCIEEHRFRQAIGIAVETRRMDMLESVLRASDPIQEHLSYTQQIALKHINKIEHRRKILSLVASMSASLERVDYVFVCDCLVAMQDAEGCARVLSQLFRESLVDESIRPVIYQIGFNIAEDASQEFASKISSAIQSATSSSSPSAYLQSVLSVISGLKSTELRIEFLYRNNHSDLLILEKTKESLIAHNSMHHSVLTCANGIMHCGTTSDEFLRKNLEWLSYASNWAKFTAASTLGMIHRGQAGRGRQILDPYLPKEGVTTSPYSEGGSIFALGLINVGHGLADKEYYLEQLSASESEIIHHGASLGLGAAAMSSHDPAIVEALKGILYHDNAVSGEGAAIAIGLVLHASGNGQVAAELVQYAHETQHEKIIRSLALSLALIYTGLADQADGIIEQLLQQKDPILRYGGVWTVATAYAGSSDSRAIGRLLHTAVSDANDDVRRAAVMSLGFVLCQNAAELPRLIELLTQSYNPHVRYGAAIALGIAFAGTGNKIPIELIKPMCKDMADYVRQGAYIALAMIMMQNNEQTCEEVAWARSAFETSVATKNEDGMAKFGAVLAQGIIDASGRNAVLSLLSSSGHVSPSAVAGAMLFCQFWYWYPLINFVALALRPTALIAVDEALRLPKFQVHCRCKPSKFAYPPPIKTATVAAPKKLVTAVLSTTAKAAARAKKAHRASEMEVDSETTTSTAQKNGTTIPEPPMMMEGVEKTAIIGTDKTPEADSCEISNLSRVLPSQLALLTFPPQGKFVPLRAGSWQGGILVVADSLPEEPANYFEPTDYKSSSEEAPHKEPDPPEPFECPEI